MPSYPAQKLREHQIYSSHFLKGMLPFRFFENITYTVDRGANLHKTRTENLCAYICVQALASQINN
jgi:hypothetical protein